MTLLALAGARRPRAEPVGAGRPRAGRAALAALARAGLDAARAAVARAFRASPPAALADALVRGPRPRARLLAPLAREARAQPLSIAVPLAYLAARREEIRRLALALRGAALGLPPEELLDLVEA